jgi:hypothetical protein
MEFFNVLELQPFLFLLIGLISILFSIFKKTKTADLKLTGEKTEGIIFELGSRRSSSTNSNILDKVTVRFVTKSKKWVTADINQAFSTFFTGQYKLGEKIDVYYDPQDPSNFFVDTKQSEQMSSLIFGLIGMVLCIVGIYKLFGKI